MYYIVYIREVNDVENKNTRIKRNLANPSIRLDIAVSEFEEALKKVKHYEKDEKKRYVLHVNRNLHAGKK
jgi:hypothetical protein